MDRKAIIQSPRQIGKSFRLCIMGEKCDCINNHGAGGCRPMGNAVVTEAVADMACLTVCWAYRQRLSG